MSNVETKVLNLGLVPLIRWAKNGDHPQDDVGKVEPDIGAQAAGKADATYVRQEGRIVRYYRHPETPEHQECTRCSSPFNDHGWVDSGGAGRVVCPGDWVIVSETPEDAYVFTDEQVKILAPDDIAIVAGRAHEAADEIDDALSENVGAIACVVQGLARAAASALEQARDLAAGGGIES